MNRKARTAVAAVGASLIAMSGPSLAHASTPATSATVTTRDGSSGNTAAREKKAVLNLLAAYRTGNAAAFDVINPEKFIQHDPQLADGLAGLKAWLASIPQGQISVTPVRGNRQNGRPALCTPAAHRACLSRMHGNRARPVLRGRRRSSAPSLPGRFARYGA